MFEDQDQATVSHGKSLLSLKQYETITKKFINKHVWAKSLRKSLTNDDEFIGECITALANADTKFDGRGTILGYRSSVLKYALKNYLNNIKKQSKRIKQPLTPDSAFYLEKTEKRTENQDTIDSILSKLSDRQAQMLRLYYIDGHTALEIKKILNLDMTKQGIYDIINRGLEKCRLLSN